ncbi:MAG: ScyD/ScyE family protein [Pyrinomonadaceae bacterium]
MFLKKFTHICVAVLLAGFAQEIHAQTTTVFTEGLNAPQKIIHVQRQEIFLVSEAGNPAIPNNGRVSLVTRNGSRFTVIDGLPSGAAAPNADPSGPSAIAVVGNKLYIAIGVGNATIAGPAPGSELPNPNLNSPIFSTVLELRLPPFGLFLHQLNYHLTTADHARLANGQTILLGHPLRRGRLRVVADFPDFTPAPRPGFPDLVRNSNPFGLVVTGGTLYVADASQNMIRTADLDDGEIGTLITYPSRPNPNFPMGPPFIDPVPDSLRLFNNKLLVTFLTGFPFPDGVADVRQYDLESGVESQLIGGLRSAIDVLPVDEGGFCSTAYTLEFSANMLMGAPGRLQRFDTPAGPPTLISDSLISPTSMARDPHSGDLFVTEIFTGRIMRISLP